MYNWHIFIIYNFVDKKMRHVRNTAVMTPQSQIMNAIFRCLTIMKAFPEYNCHAGIGKTNLV